MCDPCYDNYYDGCCGGGCHGGDSCDTEEENTDSQSAPVAEPAKPTTTPYHNVRDDKGRFTKKEVDLLDALKNFFQKNQ
jgi:hypothetical protein